MSGGKVSGCPGWAVSLLIIVALVGGCLSGKIIKGRKQFYAGNYSDAASTLSGIKDEKGKNRILALMEYGAAMHASGNYGAGTDALLEAAKLIEATETISVSEKAVSGAVNKMTTTYRPEHFERVLVHTYLAMNFMMSDNFSAARVEAKKALKILNSLDEELQKQPFTRYVCGLAYELVGDYDDAYIEYKRVVKSVPGALPVYRHLYRIARNEGKREDVSRWADKISKLGGNTADEPKGFNFVAFAGAGRSPVKREINIILPPKANRFVVPDYVSSGSRAHHAVLDFERSADLKSFVLTDLNPLAEKTLKKRIAKQIAAETLRVGGKEAVARAVEEQEPLLGMLLRLVFFATESADTRSWETLPRYLSAASAKLEPGNYRVRAQFYTAEERPIGNARTRDVVITGNRKSFISLRCVQ